MTARGRVPDADAHSPSDDDRRVVERQLGRSPRGPWRVVARCEHGFPTVVETAPRLDDGTPFPTLYWLACPRLAGSAGARESAGACDAWAARLADDAVLAAAAREADAAYRDERARAAGGADPCAGTGIAGERDPRAVKCVHARVAAALAGIPDPIGLETLAGSGAGCPDARCARFRDPADSPAPRARKRPERPPASRRW